MSLEEKKGTGVGCHESVARGQSIERKASCQCVNTRKHTDGRVASAELCVHKLSSQEIA